MSVPVMSRRDASIKRAIDVAGAVTLFVTLAPVMALVALSIGLTSPGPILYRQVRVGRDGYPFTVVKFRTMIPNAEAGTGPVWARRGDSRQSAVGRLLRATNLDELPQLFNVLRGEMSLVGPRPERPEFVQRFRREIPGYAMRHAVLPGMTGWAQIRGWRGATALEPRIACDLDYIARWSVGRDLLILLATPVLGFRNAH